MKRNQKIFLFFTLFSSILLVVFSCSKNQKSPSGNSSKLQVMLTDSPDPNVKEVWVDITQIEIIMSDTSNPITLNGAHPGLYNLLDLTNGKDTLLADAVIPKGSISQIRLILGDNNYIITNDDIKFALKTPSGQESGLKVQVHQDVSGGIYTD